MRADEREALAAAYAVLRAAARRRRNEKPPGTGGAGGKSAGLGPRLLRGLYHHTHGRGSDGA